jgi:hypothetical protein
MSSQIRIAVTTGVVALIMALHATAGFSQPAKHADNDFGWTGRTVVVGSHSSVADNAASTREHQIGQY